MLNIYSELGDYQIRDVCYLGGKNSDPNPTRFDVVKFYDHEPYECIVIENGKSLGKRTTTRSCYSIGFLKWDSEEGYWEFESVGLRYLEDSNTIVNNWILDWCKRYAKEHFKGEEE